MPVNDRIEPIKAEIRKYLDTHQSDLRVDFRNGNLREQANLLFNKKLKEHQITGEAFFNKKLKEHQITGEAFFNIKESALILVDSLLSESLTSKVAWQCCKMIAEFEQVSTDIKYLISSNLGKEPNKGGKEKGTHAVRNLCIAKAVEIAYLKDPKLAYFSNSNPYSMSACQIVSEVLVEYRIQLAPTGVIDIYKEFKPLIITN